MNYEKARTGAGRHQRQSSARPIPTPLVGQLQLPKRTKSDRRHAGLQSLGVRAAAPAGAAVGRGRHPHPCRCRPRWRGRRAPNPSRRGSRLCAPTGANHAVGQRSTAQTHPPRAGSPVRGRHTAVSQWGPRQPSKLLAQFRHRWPQLAFFCTPSKHILDTMQTPSGVCACDGRQAQSDTLSLPLSLSLSLPLSLTAHTLPLLPHVHSMLPSLCLPLSLSLSLCLSYCTHIATAPSCALLASP